MMRPLCVLGLAALSACATRAPLDPSTWRAADTATPLPDLAPLQDPQPGQPAAETNPGGDTTKPQDPPPVVTESIPRAKPDPGPGRPEVQPWKLPRMEHPGVLQEGAFEAVFTYENNDESSAFRAGLGYGVTDRVTIHSYVGSGDQPDTVFLGDKPGIVFDIGGQVALNDPNSKHLYAARLDVVLSDEESFEFVNRTTDSKANFQPSFIAGWGVDEGAAFFAEIGARLGESTDPALVAAGAVTIPVKAVTFVVEVDAAIQDDADEVYVTPAVVFNPRDKIQLRLSPSIGLTEDSLDWRVMATFGVRF